MSDSLAPTTLYLLRHGATAANLERPYRLQGRRVNPPLAELGISQAKLTRDLLANVHFDHIYTSPLHRAAQTAQILGEGRSLEVRTLDQLAECDVGRWEGKTWEEIRLHDSERSRLFEADPACHGYPDGETFQQVADRVGPCLDRLINGHAGEQLLVIGHHVVNRVYLAGLLGLPPSQAKQVRLDNCGVSIVVNENGQARVATLNATFHLK
jgi:broad specificity phosphatase PhoE